MYADNGRYNAFDGLDLLPSVPGKFVFDSAYGRSEFTYLSKQAHAHIGKLDGRLIEGSCVEAISAPADTHGQLSNTSGSARPPLPSAWFSTQRVGPLMSRGGGSLYQLGWADAGRLSASIQTARLLGGSVGIAAVVAAPVDEQGAILGSPPLLVSRMTIVPGGGTYRDWGTWHCILDPESGCVDLAVLAATRADRTPALGSDEAAFSVSYTHDDGVSYAKLVDQPLALRAEISDVRPHGAEPIMWHVQLALRVERSAPVATPKAEALPSGDGMLRGDERAGAVALSTHEAHNPMYVCPGQLGCLSQAIRVPLGVDSFFFYTGRMPAGGMLVAGRMHARKSLLRQSLLFDATPQQLGFAAAPWSPFWSQEGTRLFLSMVRTHSRLWPRMAHEPMLLEDEGFDTFDELRTYVLRSLKAAARDAERAAERGDSVAGSWSNPYPSRWPKLVCSATGPRRVDNGNRTARTHRPRTSCDEWRFERLQQYTVLSLQGPTEGVDVGSATSQEADAADGDTLAYQHDVWSLDYAAADGVSRYTIDFGSVVPDALANTTSSGKSLYKWNLPHLYLYRGTPPYSPTLYCHVIYTIISAHYIFGEFQALLFLPPRYWGLLGDSLGLNLTLLVTVTLFALVFPLVVFLSACLLATPEAYSLDPCVDVQIGKSGRQRQPTLVSTTI